MAHIIYLGPQFSLPAAQAVLESRWNVLNCAPESQALIGQIRGAVGLLDACMRVEIGDRVMQAADMLRVVSTATTGADHIDQKLLSRRGIPLLTLRGEKELLKKLTPAAELSWTLLMACARRLTGAAASVQAGGWIREDYPGVMLYGKTLGLIGCGRIGSWMARYGTAFGMRVQAYDPHLDEWPEGVGRRGLDELCRTSDFISIHVPLCEETRRLVGRRQFELMKAGVILVNTSRGAVIDEDCLLEALLSGRLAGAGLDVLQGEPDIESHPLLAYARANDNLIITPHIGGFSPDAVVIAVDHAARRLKKALLGEFQS